MQRLCVDRHGIGMNLAENLQTEFRSRVEGLALIGQVKEGLAVGLKIAFENEALAIPRDRELTAQIHSIKKTATDAGTPVSIPRRTRGIMRTGSGRLPWPFTPREGRR